jgi:hypothetical protein
MLEKKYVLEQSGIGDVIIFLSWLYQTIGSKIPVYIDFNKDNINTWKESPDEYYNFLIDFAQYILPSDNFIIQRGLIGNKVSVEEIFAYYPAYFIDFKFMDLRHKVTAPMDLNKITINTKVRGLNRNGYNVVKKKFFDILNESEKEFVILGEREIEYGKEYKLHGENAIYSIYNDIIENLPKDKITDLTIPKLGITLPNLDTIKNDINIISKHKSICFGSSGIVSLCCCFAVDTRSCISSTESFSRFLDSHHNKLKDLDNFIKDLPNFLP